MSVVWGPGSPAAEEAGYSLVRVEGRIFSPRAPQPPDTVPLHIWYSPSRGDYFSSTESVWRGGPGETRSPDYQWIMLQGYVFDQPVAGTMPLYHWFNFSLGDNLETSDPHWEASGTSPRDGYEMGLIQGYVYPPTMPQAPEISANFHYGGMGTAEGPLVGERPLVLFLLGYSDQPFRLGFSFWDNWAFGPNYPNARDYLQENSQGLFTWSRGGVIGPITPVDDPDTTGNEALWRDNWDMNYSGFLYLSLTAPSGALLSCANGGGPGSQVHATGGGYEHWERLALVDLNGGALMNGDVVCFKTIEGTFLRQNAGLLYADGTSTSSTSARFIINKTGGGQIFNNDQVTFICVGNSRWVQAAGGGGGDVTVSATTPGADGLFRISKGGPTTAGMVRQAAQRAAQLGLFDPATYDGNHDGQVTSDELTLMTIGSSPESPDDSSGSNRWPGRFGVPGSSTVLDLGLAATAGETVSFATFTHELAHQLGTGDLYGCGCMSGDITLMSCTVGNANDPKIFNLDPWHRLREGWDNPLIRMVRQPGCSERLLTLDTLSNLERPVLLYDPTRYDLSTGVGEYLMLEYRTHSYASQRYDNNVYTEGLAVWYVNSRADGSLNSVPVPCGNAVAAFVLGQPDSRPGDGQLWTAANGRFTLRWPDSTTVPMTLQVSPGPYTNGFLDVEWTPGTVLMPRLDTCTQVANPYSFLLAIDGMFPIRQSSNSLVRLVGALTINCPIRSWDLSHIVVQVPHGTPAGTYQVELWNGPVRGNRLAWQLNSTVNTPPGIFQFSASEFSVSESAGAAVIIVNRAGGASGMVTVQCQVSDDTALAGSDYLMPLNTTLTFLEGETSQTLTIPIINDALDEDDELVRLTLAGPTGGATITGINPVSLRIVDDDPLPAMSIADTTVTEADNAAATAFFTVTLSSPSGRRVIANYSTRNGTASAGVDYTPQTEQVIFEIGETTKQIPIQVLGDTLNEADEAFFVDLISGENATFDRSTASCTILDNDPLPSVTVNNLVVTEGDDGSIPASFHLQLSAASGRSVQFFAATADGTAHAGEDYVAVSGLVTISPGSPDAFFQVHVTGTPGPEADEVLYLRLSSPVNTTLAVSEATLTIKELRFLSSRRDGADMVLTFPTGNIGQRYHLERRDSFAPSSAWTPLTAPEGILGTGDVFTFRDVGAIGRATGFYRILQTGP